MTVKDNEPKINIENVNDYLKRERRKAKIMAAWHIAKAVLFPFVVILAAIGFVVFGALFAILGESFKRITK